MVAIALAGCSTPSITAPNPIEIGSAEYTRVYTAAVQVLRDHGFRIDGHSHRFGKITTRHQPAPTIFEPWLAQTTTSQQAWANTLNDQRHKVEITLEPIPADQDHSAPTHPQDTGSYQMRVQVLVERHQFPNRFLTGSTASHQVLGTLSSTPTELRERGIAGSYWQPLGRDTHLEQRLLAEIIRKSLEVETSP